MTSCGGLCTGRSCFVTSPCLRISYMLTCATSSYLRGKSAGVPLSQTTVLGIPRSISSFYTMNVIMVLRMSRRCLGLEAFVSSSCRITMAVVVNIVAALLVSWLCSYMWGHGQGAPAAGCCAGLGNVYRGTRVWLLKTKLFVYDFLWKV